MRGISLALSVCSSASKRRHDEIILGPSIYEEKRFGGVELAQETRDLLDSKPEGEELARLNRLLLDDALLNELELKPE